MNLTVKRVLIIGVSLLFAAALVIVQYLELNRQQVEASKEVIAPPVVSLEAQPCIDCHQDLDNTPNVVVAWQESTHAAQGVDCLACHKTQEGDFDKFQCPGSTTPVASHPTPKDCQECHEQEVVEFGRSKHAAMSTIKLAGSFDRTVFEPTLATKNGCQQCHNIGHIWPDQSVGECDACHAKHTFDVAVARNPYTCGECHLGPDHPHIEMWLESKHGNVFTSFQKNWENLGYTAADYEGKPAPLNAPTCATCHMSGGPGLNVTHDVGERLAWETQAPWTIRTTAAWGGGQSWEQKRANMEAACAQCHSPNFYERYLLTGDLSVMQYNEIFKESKRWLTAMKDNEIILTPGVEGLAPFVVAGYDEAPEETSYHMWHHEGRRYRQGALMMAADYTQWHGIWDLQRDLVDIIRYAGEHDLPEAKAWLASPDPNKYWFYPFYDVPGSPWGIDTLAYRKSEEHTTPILVNRSGDDYWDRAGANVEAAWKNNLISDKQWALWQELYADLDRENGQIFALPPDVKIQKEGDKVDATATQSQVTEFKLPAGGYWEWSPEQASGGE
ncbi:MAG: multiheme c-type cytochrome [Chloroflexota bacterium]